MSTVETLEERRLFTFVAGDPDFGKGGLVSLGVPSDSPQFDASRPIIVPIADGRVLVYGTADTGQSGNVPSVRYLRSDGTPDTARGGGDGHIEPGFSVLNPGVGVAIDPASGRVAFLTAVGNDAQAHLSLKIDLHDANGKRIASAQFADVDTDYSRSATIGFTADGGLVVASRQFKLKSGAQTPILIVRRFDKALKLASTFGDNGTVQLSVPEFYTLGTPGVDAKGRVYVPAYIEKSDAKLTTRYIQQVYRLTASGSLDASYGTKGLLTVVSEAYKHTDETRAFTKIDDAVAPDGTVYVLSNTLTMNVKVRTAQTSIYRVGADGTVTHTAIGRPTTLTDKFDGRLAVGPDGDVYVSTRGDGTATMVYRLRAGSKGTLASVDSWSDFGDAAQMTINLTTADLAIDKSGRVLMAGQIKSAAAISSPYVYRFDGRTSFSTLKDGSAQRLSDGTVVVKGQPGDDTIVIDHTSTYIEVTLNSKLSKFKRNDVHGLLVLGGRGDDKVSMNLGGTSLGAFLQGDGGNDSMTGSVYSDTLLGGDGNDRLDGGTQSGSDHLYGQAGNDTVFGGFGGDELFGGDGNDRLYASGDVNATKSNDVARDLLDGGHGADYLLRDTINVNDPTREYDAVGTIDKDDTLRGS